MNNPINRRRFLKATTALAALPALTCNSGREKSASQKPNIILIMADDLGYECLGCNGGTSYQTPVLNRLAREGMRFEHCYAQPLCTPSRVKIMTGIYNVRNYVKFGILDKNETTFANLLRQNGYATCVTGKWQLGGGPDSPDHFGFDEYILWQHLRGRTDEKGHDTRYPNPHLEVNGEKVEYNNGEYGPDVVSDYGCDFIERHQDQPFFVYYPMILTHCPFVPTPASEEWDPNNHGSLEYKGNPVYFADMVSYMDSIVGKIVDKLESLGIRENTLLLFTGDNGTDQPVVSLMNGRKVVGGKGKMTNAGTRVPLIANWPRAIPKNSVSDDLIDFSDFLPTLCEAAGVELPDELKIDGRSFLPQLKGKKGNPRDWIYCWYSRSGESGKAKEFVRSKRYKLYQSGEFYDIKNDVHEKNDLKKDELNARQKKIRAFLKAQLDKFENARPEELR